MAKIDLNKLFPIPHGPKLSPEENAAAYGHGRFDFSGQSADTPKGQVVLLVPTPTVARATINRKDRRIRDRSGHNALIERAIEQTRRLFGEDVQA